MEKYSIEQQIVDAIKGGCRHGKRITRILSRVRRRASRALRRPVGRVSPPGYYVDPLTGSVVRQRPVRRRLRERLGVAR